MDDLIAYMAEKNLPADLQARIMNHFKYKWQKKGGSIDNDTITEELPVSLRTDIALFEHRDALQKIPLFKHTSSTFLSVLVRMLRPSLCAPGEYIVKCGDVGREMYFLQKGVCTVMNASEDTIYAVSKSHIAYFFIFR